MEALCVIGGQCTAFYISQMNCNAKANLRRQSRAEIFTPIDFSYEMFVFLCL